LSTFSEIRFLRVLEVQRGNLGSFKVLLGTNRSMDWSTASLKTAAASSIEYNKKVDSQFYELKNVEMAEWLAEL
jgi:hypothetical protein